MKPPFDCKQCPTYAMCINQTCSQVYSRCEPIRTQLLEYFPDPDYPKDPVQNWAAVKTGTFKEFLKAIGIDT